MLTDEQLITQIRAGNDDLFRELIIRYQSQIAATVKGLLGPVAEADDVGQETFIRFYRNLKNFRMESSVGTYLTRIAINLSLNEIKRRKRSYFLFRPIDSKMDIPDTGQEFDTELIDRAISKLSPPFRAVLVLRLINGYSTRETAEILKIAEGTVLSRLARAQQKLKEILDPYRGDLL